MFKKSKPLLDTIVTITVVSQSQEEAEQAIDEAFRVIERFGGLVDFYSESSELSAINRSAGIAAVEVASVTLDLIEKAVLAAEQTGGAFDPTIGPVIKLWDFHKKVRPADQEIRKHLGLVNYREIRIDRSAATVFLPRKGMLLDLGGIAKGYAADLAAASLRERGISGALIAVAGDIRAFGRKPDGTAWNIGIRNPRRTGESDDILATVGLADRSISTSGDYERFFMIDDKRYHHLLDPKTGYPAGGCRSVNVIAGEGVFADAFSTAFFVMGPEQGLRRAGELGLDAIIIDENGVVHETLGIKGRLKYAGSN